MIGSIFSGWMWKIGAGVVLALLIICGGLWWSHQRLAEANANLKADLILTETVLAEQEAALSEAIKERDRIEKVMSDRLAAERAIRARNERELRERNTQLAKLRKEYENIEKFLSIPVPPDFVDRWMRGKDDIENKD
jgi:hypothetical protein